MKARSFVAFLILLLPAAIYSQNKKTPEEDRGLAWSVSYSYGISGTVDDYNSYGSGEGKFSSIEISSLPENDIGFFMNYSTTEFKNIYSGAGRTGHNDEYTAGAKFYFKDKRVFFSLGGGIYDIAKLTRNGWGIEYNYFIETERDVVVGLNLGFGTRINLNESFGLVISSKLHAALTNRLDQDIYAYVGANAGIEINNSKNSKYDVERSKLSTGILAGNVMNTGNLMSSRNSNGRIGAELTYNISDKFSFVGNYLHRRNNKTGFSFSENDYSGGVRYYGSNGNLKVFLENLVNLNIQKEQLPWLPDNLVVSNSLGLTFGFGAEFVLANGISGLIKINMTKLDRPETYTGLLGGVKYNF